MKIFGQHEPATIAQLGTVDRGNHYVDGFADETGSLWVGVHFGSRGFGHTIASGFLALGQGKWWGERAPEREVLLDLEAPLGHDSWHLMHLAGRYAYAGREEHTIDGGRESVVVLRKSVTPAFPGQLGFVGGSMGDDAVIVRGGGLDEAPQADRRLPEVLTAHEGTVEVLHTLTPLVVVMAGADEFDPYKD